MKKIFKSLLMSALVLTAGAFVACTENGEEGNKKFEGMPEIEAVADVEGVTFEGGVVEVTVTSNAPWTAEVSAEDVTLSKSKGNGDAVVNVTIPATTEAREISVVFTAVGYMEGIELTATSSVSLFQNATGKLTISNITPDVVGEGAEFSLKDVLVVAVGAEAYVIADETGSMIVYHKDNGRAVGEKININGQVTVYSNGKGSVGTPQFANTSVVEVVSTGNEVTYNPTVLDAATFDALLNATVAQEVQVTGTWEVSGNYVNLVVNGATNKGSIKYIATADYASFNGQDVIIKGYFVGISASGDLRYINIMPYSVEADPNAPLLNVDKTEITFAATDDSNARKTFTATTNGLEGYELTWAIDNTEDFNLGKQLGNPSRTTLYVTPKAAN
ncbi:MAG: BACON domain-containing protein, partial [Alistipes sp.]|nr:BACON domain-containing protein [Alistipes sp.]